MRYWLAACVVAAAASGLLATGYDEDCDASAGRECAGEGYRCVRGRCHCAPGYVLASPYQYECVPCPGYMQQCWGYCCSSSKLQCWQGICQRCHDNRGRWICGEQISSQVLISATQIAMGAALVLGLLATFLLLYKLCATPDARPFGVHSFGGDGRLSIGSMQLYVEERLRDAPPRYTRQSAGGPPVFPLNGYHNAGFIHDSSVPPPPYTELKDDTRQQSTHTNAPLTVHI